MALYGVLAGLVWHHTAWCGVYFFQNCPGTPARVGEWIDAGATSGASVSSPAACLRRKQFWRRLCGADDVVRVQFFRDEARFGTTTAEQAFSRVFDAPTQHGATKKTFPTASGNPFPTASGKGFPTATGNPFPASNDTDRRLPPPRSCFYIAGSRDSFIGSGLCTYVHHVESASVAREFEQLSTAGGIDRRSFTSDYLERLALFGFSGRVASDAFTVACLMSHRRVWSLFLASGDPDPNPYAFVFESDARVSSGVSADFVRTVLSKMPVNWDILNLARCWDLCDYDVTVNSVEDRARVRGRRTQWGQSSANKPRKSVSLAGTRYEPSPLHGFNPSGGGGRRHNRGGGPPMSSTGEDIGAEHDRAFPGRAIVSSANGMCTAGYVVTARGAAILLEYSLPYVVPVDVLIAVLVRASILRGYSVTPPVVTQHRERSSHDHGANVECDPSASTASLFSSGRRFQLWNRTTAAVNRNPGYKRNHGFGGSTKHSRRRHHYSPPPGHGDDRVLDAITSSKLWVHSNVGAPPASEPPGTKATVGGVVRRPLCAFGAAATAFSSTGSSDDKISSTGGGKLGDFGPRPTTAMPEFPAPTLVGAFADWYAKVVLAPLVTEFTRAMEALGLRRVVVYGLTADDDHTHKAIHRDLVASLRVLSSSSSIQVFWVPTAGASSSGCGYDRSEFANAFVFASPKHMWWTSDPFCAELPFVASSVYVFHEVVPPKFRGSDRVGQWIVRGPDGNWSPHDSDHVALRRRYVCVSELVCIFRRDRVLVAPWGVPTASGTRSVSSNPDENGGGDDTPRSGNTLRGGRGRGRPFTRADVLTHMRAFESPAALNPLTPTASGGNNDPFSVVNFVGTVWWVNKGALCDIGRVCTASNVSVHVYGRELEPLECPGGPVVTRVTADSSPLTTDTPKPFDAEFVGGQRGRIGGYPRRNGAGGGTSGPMSKSGVGAAVGGGGGAVEVDTKTKVAASTNGKTVAGLYVHSGGYVSDSTMAMLEASSGVLVAIQGSEHLDGLGSYLSDRLLRAVATGRPVMTNNPAASLLGVSQIFGTGETEKKNGQVADTPPQVDRTGDGGSRVCGGARGNPSAVYGNHTYGHRVVSMLSLFM